MQIAAGKFKSHCLAIMDDVQAHHESVIITKRGKPVAKLVPIVEEVPQPLFGMMRGHVRIKGDIVASTGEVWHADA